MFSLLLSYLLLILLFSVSFEVEIDDQSLISLIVNRLDDKDDQINHIIQLLEENEQNNTGDKLQC
jgi:hypothetical protein